MNRASRKRNDVELVGEIDLARQESDEPPQQFKSTQNDVIEMQRMGRSQQLVRHYRLFSMVSFVAVAISSWQLTIFQITPGLLNGGMPVLMYSNIWAFVGFGPIILSMAEMASMAPIAGAQYHWVSEFAPAKYQKLLSYITGWTSTLAWQAGNAGSIILVGTLIQTVIQLNNPDYSFPNWHGTIIAIVVIFLSCAINIFASKSLPYWQNAAFTFSFLVYFAFIIPIWVAAPQAKSTQVWNEFTIGDGAWPTMALAILVGQQPALIGQVGIDTAAHMSEEVRNASVSVPRTMIIVYLINLVLNILTTATLCYHMPDVKAALADASTYPAIWVLRQVMSNTWLTVLLVLIIALLVIGAMTYLTAVSRDLFAFGRDNGLPFSAWIAAIDKRRHIPINAYIVTAVIGGAMCLIYLGSSVAFYAICSLCAVALLQCYCLSIGCILWRRIYHPETLPPATFSLGKYGILLNFMALIFGLWSFFWCFWPTEYPITANGFNWSSPIFATVLIVAGIYYMFWGRFKYDGPVTLVRGRTK